MSDIVLIGVESSYQLWRCLHHLNNIKVSSGTHTTWGNAVRAKKKRVGGTMPQASKLAGTRRKADEQQCSIVVFLCFPKKKTS